MPLFSLPLILKVVLNMNSIYQRLHKIWIQYLLEVHTVRRIPYKQTPILVRVKMEHTEFRWNLHPPPSLWLYHANHTTQNIMKVEEPSRNS